jgi:hypothetical protein
MTTETTPDQNNDPDVRIAAQLAGIARAYAFLWHVIPQDLTGPGCVQLDPHRAATLARMVLRDLLTQEERGTAIKTMQATPEFMRESRVTL